MRGPIQSDLGEPAKKTGVLMYGDYKASVWLVASGEAPVYFWMVQPLGGESILHSGEKPTFVEAADEAQACLESLAGPSRPSNRNSGVC